jgi:hypothetical protein
MQELSPEIRAYLSTDDDYYRASLLEQYPHLEQTMADPETRDAVIYWLSSDEAYEEPFTDLTLNALEYIRIGVSKDEIGIVRPLTLSSNPLIRLHAYEVLLTLYFPDKNKEAMFILLHGMLSDDSDIVSSQAVNYIERAGAVSELRGYLERWYQKAQDQGLDQMDSVELVERLLKE